MTKASTSRHASRGGGFVSQAVAVARKAQAKLRALAESVPAEEHADKAQEASHGANEDDEEEMLVDDDRHINGASSSTP